MKLIYSEACSESWSGPDGMLTIADADLGLAFAARPSGRLLLVNASEHSFPTHAGFASSGPEVQPDLALDVRLRYQADKADRVAIVAEHKDVSFLNTLFFATR